MDSFLVGYDFYYLYAATYIWAHGGNPYDTQTFARQLRGLDWPATEGVQGLTHPPTTELFALPFVFISFVIAKWLWLGFISGLLAFSCWCAFRSQTLRKLHGFTQPLPFVLSVIAFPPVLSNVIWGQHNAIPLVGLLLCLWTFANGRLFIAGLFLGLTTLKPHLLIPFYVFLFGYELLNKRLTLILGFVSSIGIQVGLTCLVNPHSFVNYFRSFSQIGAEATAILGASPTQVLAVFYQQPLITVYGLIFGCVAAVWLLFARAFTLERLVCLVLPLSLAVSPYVWNHSFVLLLIPYLRLMKMGFNYFGDRFRFAVAALGGIGVFIGLMADLNPYSAVFPLILVAVYFLSVSRDAKVTALA